MICCFSIFNESTLQKTDIVLLINESVATNFSALKMTKNKSINLTGGILGLAKQLGLGCTLHLNSYNISRADCEDPSSQINC